MDLDSKVIDEKRTRRAAYETSDGIGYPSLRKLLAGRSMRWALWRSTDAPVFMRVPVFTFDENGRQIPTGTEERQRIGFAFRGTRGGVSFCRG